MQRAAPSPGARRRFAAVLATAVLALAAVNLGVRLDREMVDVWDESLYATTALEMLRSGDWIVTTFQCAPDYYNSKPPLNVWLIALAFRLFGASVWSLRVVSALAAAATVGVVWWSTRRLADAVTAHLAALVLVTSYPFLYVHAARTGNPDALLTLAITLTVVVAWRAHERPARAVWLGPLAAAVVMLKGPGALAFVLPIWAAEIAWRVRYGHVRPWIGPLAAGSLAAAVAVAAWAIARWRADGWALFDHMLVYDVAARGSRTIEGHVEPWWFYGRVLTRYWYDWLSAALLVVALVPSVATRAWRTARDLTATPAAWLVGGWLVATVLVPTAVPTRLAWYLHPFYPGAAVLVALAVRAAWQIAGEHGGGWRHLAIAGLLVLAVGVAEGRLIYRTRRLDMHHSPQGLIVAHAPALAGHRVFATRCPYPEAFLAAVAHSTCTVVDDVEAFGRASAPGDFWLDHRDVLPAGLERVDANRRASLHRRP